MKTFRYNLWTSRYRHLIILLVVLTILSVPLLYLHFSSSPITIKTTEGAAAILFEGDRNRLLFPSECVVVRWQVENIQAVLLDGRAEIGSGEKEHCLIDALPTLQIKLQNGSSYDYPLPIERLYHQPVILILLIAFIVVLALVAYTIMGVPGLVSVLVIALLGPMLRSLANLNNDFLAHNMIASVAQYEQNFNTLPPHFLYHLLTAVLSSSVPSMNIEVAGFVVVLGAYVLCSIAVYRMLYGLAEQPTHTIKNDLLLVGVTLTIMISGPVSLLSGHSNRGSMILFNTFHSPTMGLLKPLAIVLFFYTLKFALKPNTAKIRPIIILAILTILTALAKPNYMIAFIPAIVLVLLYSFIRPLSLNRIVLMAGILLPAAAVLAWQYLFLYGPQAQSTVYQTTETTRLAVAPLELFLTWWEVPWYWLIPDFVLSILFPLIVYVVYFRQARQNFSFNLAWLVFLIGTAYSYLLVERPNEGDGNLTWSAQVTLFILFTVAVGFQLRQNPEIFRSARFKPNWRLVLCLLIFAAHLISSLTVLL